MSRGTLIPELAAGVVAPAERVTVAVVRQLDGARVLSSRSDHIKRSAWRVNHRLRVRRAIHRRKADLAARARSPALRAGRKRPEHRHLRRLNTAGESFSGVHVVPRVWLEPIVCWLIALERYRNVRQ